MPPHRIQRYHSRPTTRSIFSPERLLTPPPNTLRSALTFIDHYDVTDPDEPETAESSSSRPKSYRPILMLKPRGEVSRAYNLQVEMKVDDKQFADIQALISRLVANHLETSLSFKRQASADLDTIYEKAVEKFPLLKRFKDNWAISDFVKLELKRTVQQARRSRKKSSKVCISTDNDLDDQ